MPEVKAKVIHEVRPREAGMIGHLQGKLITADALALKQAGELAAAKATIKDMLAKAEAREEKIRDLEEQLRKATEAPATE